MSITRREATAGLLAVAGSAGCPAAPGMTRLRAEFLAGLMMLQSARDALDRAAPWIAAREAIQAGDRARWAYLDDAVSAARIRLQRSAYAILSATPHTEGERRCQEMVSSWQCDSRG